MAKKPLRAARDAARRAPHRGAAAESRCDALGEAFGESLTSRTSQSMPACAPSRERSRYFATPRRLARGAVSTCARGRRGSREPGARALGQGARRRPWRASRASMASPWSSSCSVADARKANLSYAPGAHAAGRRCSPTSSPAIVESGAQGAADPEDDALGRGRGAVRAAGARPGDAARREASCRARCSAWSPAGTTRGHRFMGKGEIALDDADDYEAKLRDQGKVIADFDAAPRRDRAPAARRRRRQRNAGARRAPERCSTR